MSVVVSRNMAATERNRESRNYEKMRDKPRQIKKYELLITPGSLFEISHSKTL